MGRTKGPRAAHGTYQCYASWGCRLPECKAAHKTYQADLKARKAAGAVKVGNRLVVQETPPIKVKVRRAKAGEKMFGDATVSEVASVVVEAEQIVASIPDGPTDAELDTIEQELAEITLDNLAEVLA